MLEKVLMAALHELIEVVPEGVVFGRHLELVEVGLQCLAYPLGALPRLVRLDTGETVAQNGPGRIEHPGNQGQRGQAGGQ